MNENGQTPPQQETKPDSDEAVDCPNCGEGLVRPFEEPAHESFFLVYAQARENDVEVKVEKGIAVLPLLCPECGKVEIYNNPAFGPKNSDGV
ncbi:MAG: hypothetical protein ABEK50_00180 [bacterium]